MDQIIRRAARGDVPVLVDLMREFYAEANTRMDFDRAAGVFEQLIAEPARGAAWLLEAASEPAGYIVLTVGFSLEYGGLDAFVDELFVRAPFRRQGLGRAALAELMADCKRRSVRATHLEVDRRNTSAKALCGRFGFRDNDRQLLTLRLASGSDAHAPRTQEPSQ